jgi:hypothetical protein
MVPACAYEDDRWVRRVVFHVWISCILRVTLETQIDEVATNESGVVTSLDKLSAAHLSTLLGEALNDPTYRENACRIQKAIVNSRPTGSALQPI